MLDLNGLMNPRHGRTRRFSSWDRSGGNADYLTILPGESTVLAETSNAGVIRHIWMTVNHEDPLYLRGMVLRMWWDGASEPSVECPLGDFFGLGNGIVRSYQSLMLNAVCESSIEGNLGGGVALNCYFPMPHASMRIEIENQSPHLCKNFYYYIDYDEIETSNGLLRFHAAYNQEMPTVTDEGSLAARGLHYWDMMETPNLSANGNYILLDTEGEGHYVGCNLSVVNIDPALPLPTYGENKIRTPELTWWGEGDDMIFIDDDTWPPSLHGTGSEDYFTQAWGMHDKAYLFAGTSCYEHDARHQGRHALTAYRHHILDPIVFRKRIKVTIEHGHANLQENDYSSVAYWYLNGTGRGFASLPPYRDRIPRFARE